MKQNKKKTQSLSVEIPRRHSHEKTKVFETKKKKTIKRFY